MPQLRVALAQVDATVGDITGNAAAVLRWSQQAAQAGAHLVAFPEMMLTGYPIEDLALRASFVDASRSAVEDLAAALERDGLGDLVVVCGFLDRAEGRSDQPGAPKGSPQNAAAVIHGGKIVARYAKHHLPNYGVFDESRYFVPGEWMEVVRIHGVDVAVCICEDLWQDGPAAAARAGGAGLLLVLNGSPYEPSKDDVRLQLCAERAREAGCALGYVNLVGGQDELVFGGHSLVVDASGELVSRAGQFVEELLLVDLELPAAAADDSSSAEVDLRPRHSAISERPVPAYDPLDPRVARLLDASQETYQAIVVGLKDYVRKNRFSTVVLGLSGGIDSALTAAVACDALGADNVHGVAMPSRYSSDHALHDAADLAGRLGLRYRVIPIQPLVDSFLAALELRDVAEENLQARVRGIVLMGLSNQHGHLVLATGNKTELAVGYSTLYGDAVGGFAPLKDLPKTQVWQLAKWRNAAAESDGDKPVIPQSSISKPPSAELRPGQLDTDTLPDYHLLDDLLDDYVEDDRGSAELVSAGFDPQLVERVLAMVDRAEYKRRQYPPGPKVSARHFGRDRRLPITNSWREGSSAR